MIEQDQIKALAELDGWKLKPAKGIATEDAAWYGGVPDVWTKGKKQTDLPYYLTSYDAIIPLIQKQSEQIQDDIGTVMCKMDAFRNKWFWQATPSQLSEALLRATNLWKE